MKQAMVVAAVVGLMAASGVNAEVVSKADPAKAQQIVNTVCVACHGADGNSPAPANPKLASQHPDYLNKQLTNFKSGERKSAIMAGMAAALTPEDMKNLAAYFGGQKQAPAAAQDKVLAAQGEKIYRGGVAEMGVPACSGCHGPTGSGIPAMFPRLAGQHGEYIETQLKNFRISERANDPGKMMQMVAMKMSDKDMKAVAEYISGLH
ncbi:cytochrome c oxidase [Sulfuricella denitrificans skB26]|uniref:Cytochrome c oxidase n=1 Tax=Sulfuricella denitrificans (strain DSM 22764 / NBRC 105220 / skB26) TaxID=1163617 RepID=S6APB9_SULDS|nr:c-type cytochrome [Sulfuricella denitrificans]BAN36734.1 cytochrome c oxidase [Sulfuricella denitrificans skB26]